MNHPILRALGAALILSFLPSGCVTPPPPSEEDAVPALRAFMVDYGRELVAGDTVALERRYDPVRFLSLMNGRTIIPPTSPDSFSWAGWQRPAYFAWDSLTFDVPAPGIASVLGRFRIIRTPPDTQLYSYAAFLRRTPQGWRIRNEIETRLR